MLEGSNIVVLDLETARSADACLYCDSPAAEHTGYAMHGFRPIGWKNHAALGLSIGCWFDYQDGLVHWFDEHTLLATMQVFVQRQPLIVSFNGIAFDGPLMAACCPPLPATPTSAVEWHILQENWRQLWARSYDILDQIWRQDPERKFERGLNSLGAISQANSYGAKEMDGATAPRLWQQGHYAEVLNYCQGDVLKTRLLFEHIVATGQMVRGDGRPLALPPPVLLVPDGTPWAGQTVATDVNPFFTL